MKTLKIAFMTLGIVAFVSCNDTSKKKVESNTYAAETPDNNMDNLADDNLVGDNTTINDEYLTLNTETMHGMYKYLDMDQEQIINFENDYNKKIKDMGKNNNISQIDNEKLQQQRGLSLKPVLSPEQYKKYEQWQKEYPSF
ncbi:hypothetical protein [Aequorivita capsosiphonis]|uniref:hypothetical protein n=1 Tax=Aequorivita capsosiphonis TaxID=487317 RepID=UPI000407831C|nr:hypothetical protein [Aequorivita capsosiphonis]